MSGFERTRADRVDTRRKPRLPVGMAKNIVIGVLTLACLVLALVALREHNFRTSAEQMLCGCGRVVHACQIVSGMPSSELPFEAELCR